MAKKKRCKSCNGELPGRNSMEKVCSIRCAIILTNEKKEKEYKAKTRELRKAYNNKDKKYWRRCAQKSFNRYIRARDYFLPCISCGTTNNIEYAAGHYFTVGAKPELRFNEDNVNKQCNKRCNMELSGNIALYRVGLISKIGIKRMYLLESHHEAKKYSIEDLTLITKKYNEMAKKQEKSNDAKYSYNFL